MSFILNHALIWVHTEFKICVLRAPNFSSDYGIKLNPTSYT